MVKYGIIIAITIGFSALDVITGYLNALSKGEQSSQKMRQGLLHKAAIVVAIATMALLQFAQGYIDLGINIPVLTISCSFICIMETTSILENVNKMLNGKLSSLIAKILGRSDENEK